MATGQRDPRLLAGETAAVDHLLRHLRRQLGDRPAENGDRHDRFAAHGVHVADGVGSRNAAEIEWIVDDRHEEVGGADDADAVANVVHRRIVAGFIADQQARIDKLFPLAMQDGFENFR